MLPPSPRVIYQSDDNAKLKSFLSALETTIDVSQFAAMGGTAITGIASNKDSLKSVAKSTSPIFKQLESTVSGLAKNLSEFTKGDTIKGISSFAKSLADNIKKFSPDFIKQFFGTLKPLQEFLEQTLKTAKPILGSFFKSLSSITQNIYSSLKNKASDLTKGGTNASLNTFQNTQQNLTNKATSLANKLNDLNNQASKLKTIPDDLKDLSEATADELEETNKLIAKYQELIDSKNKILDLDNQIINLKKQGLKTNAQELGDLEQKLKLEIENQKQLVKNLAPEELPNIDKENLVRKAERKITNKIGTTKDKLKDITETKENLKLNAGIDNSGNVSIKKYQNDLSEIRKLTREEEALNKVISEQETLLKGLNKVKNDARLATVNTADDVTKLATELNKSTVALQNWGKAFQTYIKITDGVLTFTSLAKGLITLKEGFEDVIRAVKDTETAFLTMQKQGFDISGFEQLDQLKDSLLLNTQSATDFVSTTVSKFNEFESSLKMVGTVFETGLKMDERTESLKEFGLTIQNIVNKNLKNTVTETEALSATYEALSAGFTTATSSAKVMEAGLKLAASSGADSGEVMRLLGKTLNAYGKDASEAARVAGILNSIVENGITTIPELSAGFGQLSTVASAVGINLEQTSAALAVLTTKGTSTAQAMTQLQSLFTAFIDPEFSKRLEKLKIDFKVNKAVVETKGLVTVLKELDNAIGGNAVKWGQLLPEIQAYRAALGLTSDGVTKLEAVTQKMVNTTAQSLENVFNIRLDNSQITSFTQIVNKLNSTLINVGRTLAPLVDQGINQIKYFTELTSSWVEKNMWLVKSLITLTMTLKGVQGVIGAVTGTTLKLLGVFTMWRFLTGKLLPDLGSLFALSTKGLEAMAEATTNNAGIFTKLGIALNHNALAANSNIKMIDKLKIVLGNLTGFGAKAGDDIRTMGVATEQTAKKLQDGRWAWERFRDSLGEGWLKLKEGAKGFKSFDLDVGNALKNTGKNIYDFGKKGLKAFVGGLQNIWNILATPVIPNAVGALSTLAAAFYGVSKGMKTIEDKKQNLKQALLDTQQNIKDTTQTLEGLIYANQKLEDLSADEIISELNKSQLTDNNNTLVSSQFLDKNKKNLDELRQLQEERKNILATAPEKTSNKYEEYLKDLKKVNDRITDLNQSLTNNLGKDLKLRVTLVNDNLEQLLNSEIEYYKKLEQIDKEYSLFEGWAENIKAAGGAFKSLGSILSDIFKGTGNWFRDWAGGGRLEDLLQLDQLYAIQDKLFKDLNNLQEQYAENLIGNYRYENLIIDGKKVEIDLQKELNNLWKQQGNILDANYTKFTKGLEAVREEINTQQKAVKSAIETTTNLLEFNKKEVIGKKYTLYDNLSSKDRDEYKSLTIDDDKRKFLQEKIIDKYEYDLINNSANNAKEYVKQISEEGQEERKTFKENILSEKSIPKLEEEYTKLIIDKRGQKLIDEGKQAEAQLEELKKINESLTKANKDLDLMGKAAKILNNRLDLNKPDSVAEAKTKNFYKRQEAIDNTLTAVEKVSKGAIVDPKWREEVLGNYKKEKGVEYLSQEEIDKIISEKMREDLTGNIKEYNTKIDAAYVDFLQDDGNKKKLEGLSDEQKYSEFYKGDSSKYNYKTKVSDIRAETKTSIELSGAKLSDSEIENLLNSDALPDQIIEQANSIIEDLDGKFITATEALKRFDKNIMKVVGDVGSENAPTLLNSRLDILRAANEEKLLPEENKNKIAETQLSGIFGENARMEEEIAKSRLEMSKSRLETEKEIYQEMVKNGQYTQAQLEEQQQNIKQLNTELLAEQTKYLETLNKIEEEKLNRQKQILSIEQSTSFSSKKTNISQLENIDIKLMENSIKTEKNKLKQLKDSNQLSEKQIKEYNDRILLMEKEFSAKKLQVLGDRLNRELEEKNKEVNRQINKENYYADLEIKNETDTQLEINKLQSKNLTEYRKYLNSKLQITKKNGGDTTELLIELENNYFEIQKNITEKVRIEYENRRKLLDIEFGYRDKYYDRLREEKNLIKDSLDLTSNNLNSTIQVLEQSVSSGADPLVNLGKEKRVLEYKQQTNKLEYDLKLRNIELDERSLKIETERQIETEKRKLSLEDLNVKQREEFLQQAKTKEEIELGNKALETAIQQREKVRFEIDKTITSIKKSAENEQIRLNLAKENLKIEKELGAINIQQSIEQNNLNNLNARMDLLKKFISLQKKADTDKKELFKLEERQLLFKQKTEERLFDLENQKLKLQYESLQIQNKMTNSKLRKDNLEMKQDNLKSEKEISKIEKQLEKLDSKDNLTTAEKELKADLVGRKEYLLDLIDSNNEITNSNLELIQSQTRNNELLDNLIQVLEENKSIFNLQQKAERAEFYSTQGIDRQTRKKGQEIAEAGERETIYNMNSYYSSLKKPPRVKNYKSGGEITADKAISQMKETTDPKEVQQLGQQVINAMKREGKDAIPIVANKNEYILNEQETRVFKDLKSQGIWDKIQKNGIKNFKEGGYVSPSRKNPDTLIFSSDNEFLDIVNHKAWSGNALEFEGGKAISGTKFVKVGQKIKPKDSDLTFTAVKRNGEIELVNNGIYYIPPKHPEYPNYSKWFKNSITQALLNAPEGTIKSFTQGQYRTFYLKTRDGITVVDKGDKYTIKGQKQGIANLNYETGVGVLKTTTTTTPNPQKTFAKSTKDVINFKGQKIPATAYNQLVNAPEGSTTKLTLDGKANYYLRTRKGVVKVGIGDTYTPSNSEIPFKITLNTAGFPVLWGNGFVYQAGRKNARYIKNKASSNNIIRISGNDPDEKYRTPLKNWSGKTIPVLEYVKNGKVFHKIAKNNRLETIKLKHGDILFGLQYFIPKSSLYAGRRGFWTKEQWKELNAKDSGVNTKNRESLSNKVLRPATEQDIQEFNASRTPKLEGHTGYAGSATVAIYRNNQTGKYLYLGGERFEGMFEPKYVRNNEGKTVKVESSEIKRLKPITIQNGSPVIGTTKVFFEPILPETQKYRGFYDNKTKKTYTGKNSKGEKITFQKTAFDAVNDFQINLIANQYSGQLYADLIKKSNYKSPTIYDRTNNKKPITNTVPIFKEGGDVVANPELNALIKKAMGGEEKEVFNLGKELIKAIHKEGKDAVPLVANKNEYILNEEDTKTFTHLKRTGLWEEIKDKISNYKLGGQIGIKNNNEITMPQYYKTKEGGIGELKHPTKKLEIEHKIKLESTKSGEKDLDMLMDIVEKKVKKENDKLMKNLEFEFKNKI